MWIIWAYITFIKEKVAIRSHLAFWVLLIIIASNYHLDFGGLEVNFATIIILIYGYFQIGQIPLKHFLYTVIGCSTISVAYACFFMFAIFDPVWVIIDLKWMVGIAMVILTLLFFHDPKMRFASLAVGLCHGEILYTLVILKLSPTKTIGDFYFLDIFASSIFIYGILYVLEQLSHKLQVYIQKGIQNKKHLYRN